MGFFSLGSGDLASGNGFWLGLGVRGTVNSCVVELG